MISSGGSQDFFGVDCNGGQTGCCKLCSSLILFFFWIDAFDYGSIKVNANKYDGERKDFRLLGAVDLSDMSCQKTNIRLFFL
jgi:hypothetical protein